MKDTELTRQQGLALYDEYKKGLEQGLFTSLRNAADYVRKQPAPRYYISEKRASVLIGMIQSNTSLVNLGHNLRRMVWQLFRDYKQYKAENPDCKLSRERILELLVERPAPEYYLSAVAVRHILSDVMKREKLERGW